MPATNNQTLKLKNVDFSLLNFSDKRETKNAKGTDNVFLSYGENSKWLYIQFPSGMRHPFDYNLNDDGSMTMTLSLDRANPKHREAIDKLKAFDDLVFQKLSENSRAWLKKPSIDENWRNSDKFVKFLKIKEMENDEGEMEERYYNIKLKLPVKDGKITTTVYDTDMKEVDPKEYIVPHCQVEPIARPARLWFQKGGKCGTTWECAFLRVKRTDTVATPAQIFDDSEDEDTPNPETSSANAAKAPTAAVESDIAGMTIEDEDDDNDDVAQVSETMDEAPKEDQVADSGEDGGDNEDAPVVSVKSGKGRKPARGKAA